MFSGLRDVLARPRVLRLMAAYVIALTVTALAYRAALELVVYPATEHTGAGADVSFFQSVQIPAHFVIGGRLFGWVHTVADLAGATLVLLALALVLHRLPRDTETRACPHCTYDLPVAASVCAHCTLEVAT
jgi:hypothetical protein